MNPRSALVLLMNHLALAEQPVLLILDDYHAVTQTEIHEQMEYFVENMPRPFISYYRVGHLHR